MNNVYSGLNKSFMEVLRGVRWSMKCGVER